MKKVKFKIAGPNGIRWRWGEIIEISGKKFGLHKDKEHGLWGNFDSWIVTHLPSGFMMAYDLDRDSAIKLATDRIPQIKSVLSKAKRILKKEGIKYPVNV